MDVKSALLNSISFSRFKTKYFNDYWSYSSFPVVHIVADVDLFCIV